MQSQWRTVAPFAAQVLTRLCSPNQHSQASARAQRCKEMKGDRTPQLLGATRLMLERRSSHIFTACVRTTYAASVPACVPECNGP